MISFIDLVPGRLLDRIVAKKLAKDGFERSIGGLAFRKTFAQECVYEVVGLCERRRCINLQRPVSIGKPAVEG